MATNSEPCIPAEGTIEGWNEMMENFVNIIYPNTFKKFGFSIPEAFAAWQLNMIRNELIDVQNLLDDKQNYE